MNVIDPPDAMVQQTVEWLKTFIRPEQVAELRAINVKQGNGRKGTQAGFFDNEHLDDMAQHALYADSISEAVYFTINPLHPEILARRANRIDIANEGDLAGDQHVLKRNWLPIDIDPRRIAKISATDEEKDAAWVVTERMRRDLADAGWPEPVVVDSGNGFYLLYRVKLPNDKPATDLVRAVIQALAAKYNSDTVSIDEQVFNAARILKVPGTHAKKGDSTDDRPHRASMILHVPEVIETVSKGSLLALARDYLPPESPTPSANGHGPNGNAARSHRLKVEDWLRDRGVPILKTKPVSNGRTAWLITCPFNSSHTGGDTAIMQDMAGKMSFHCFHAGCAGNGWQQAKERIGKPDANHFDPPLRSRDNKPVVIPSSGAAGADVVAKKPNQAQLLVQLAVDAGIELFHTSDLDAYATLPVGNHQETHRIRSRDFRLWLQHLFHQAEGKPPGAQALQDVLGVLEGKARFDADSAEHSVFVRLAGTGDATYYLDLGDLNWQAVEISKDGWQVVAAPAVKFRRAKGTLPLPCPAPEGKLELLWKYINVHKEDRPLVLAWLVAALRPVGPYPVLILRGEQGSAKTFNAKTLRSLIDPNSASTRATPRDPREFAIAANNSWMISFNNISYLPDWLSDCICRVTHGEGFAARGLYTDDEEVIFSMKRPAILNGIEEFATRADLLDRSLQVVCPEITDDARRTEKELDAALDNDRPYILAALFDAVVEGLNDLPATKLHPKPRMADFAEWVTACSSGLGLKRGAFMERYQRNIHEAADMALDGQLIYAHLRQLLAFQAQWTGTPTELHGELNRGVDETTKKSRDWPKNPQVLSNKLHRMAPSLRKVGIEVVRDHDGGRRTITLTSSRGAQAR